MASNTAIPSGYDYEFVEEVSEDYICVICQLAMRDPVQTRCGHLFCRDCLDEAYKRKPNECPSDRRLLAPQDILPHPFAERKILSFKLKCPQQGCDWQGELRDIESHERRCNHKVVDCDDESCRVRKPRHEMVRHVQEECQYRMVPCPHCKNTYTFCLFEQHTSECPKYPVSCPNKCVKTMKREEVTSHLTDKCPLTILPCSYQSIGCSFEVERNDLNDHITSHVEQHLAIAVENIVSLRKQMDDNEKSATLTNERNLKQMDEMCKRFQIQMDEMKKQTTLTNQRILKQMDDNKKSATLTSERIQKQMDEMKNEINPMVNTMTKNGEGCFSYIWEIKNFGDGLSQTFSHLFYTHKNGYKLKLEWMDQLLFLDILPGEYDHILTWPFQVREVKFTLLSQSPQQNNKELNAHQLITSVSRVVEKPNWCVVKSIAKSDTLTFVQFENYVVNDKLFLRLEIDSLSVKGVQ